MIDSLEDSIEAIRSAQYALANFTDIDEAGLKGDMKVAFQHLNLAWNSRHLSLDEYLDLCANEERFQEYGNFSKDFGLKIRKKSKST